MSGEMGCEQVREMAPDLAIGILDGQERDAALRHTETCSGCRRMVSEYLSVVDELLLLAPEQDPPLGFAGRTVARLRPAARHRRRWVAGLAIAASFVIATGLGSGAVLWSTSSDRQLAESYRAVLAQGQGSFFVAARLVGPDGSIGNVFGYEGQPSWLFATLDVPADAADRFGVRLVTRDGRQVSLGFAVLGGSHDTWGAEIPGDLTNVAQLRFEAPSGYTVVAYLDAQNPWGSG
jgi:hypothetical protein